MMEHVVTIKDAHAWSGMTPVQPSMIGFWNFILRLAPPIHVTANRRLMAFSDPSAIALLPSVGGLDPPEDVIRRIANDYSVLSF